MYTIVSQFTTIAVVLTNAEMWKVHNVCLYGGGRYVSSSDQSDPVNY